VYGLHPATAAAEEEQQIMTSAKALARMAGLLYLIVAVCGGFSELYVRASVGVPGDAAATADNISASATLFRIGALTDLVNVACFLALALVLYGLLKPVSANAAVAMLVLNAVSVAVMTANMPNHLGALRAATSEEYAGAFGAASPDALAMVFLDLHSYGYLVAGIFFGLWLLPLGYLLFRSRSVPRALGALVMVGSFGYVADAITNVLFPTVGATLTPVLVLPSVLAEVSLILWLLTKGLNVQRPLHHVPASVEHVPASG
jgi:hypothetical protein